MGTQINLKTVDFGNSGFQFFEAVLSQGGANVVKGSPNYGKLDGVEATKRIKMLPAILVKQGESVVFTGLKGKDADNNDCTLRIDACYYSQKENPSHATVVGSISDSGTTYFTLNAGLENEFTWVNNIGDYWFVFCFGSEQASSDSVVIHPDGFDIVVRVL